MRGDILNSALVQTNDANLLTSSPDSYQLRFGDFARTSGNIRSELLATAEITAGNIEINSANNFTNLAAKISSSEDLKISAAENINIETLQLRNRAEEHWGNKKNGGDRITDTTTNLQSEISAQGNIEITSGNDTTLQAAKLTAAENININSENNLLLLTAQNTDFKMESIRKNKTFTFKNNDNGAINSAVLNNEIVTNGTVNLEAQNTAYIEYKSGTDPLTPDGYSATSSQLQNLKAETVLKNPIDEIHKSWNQTNRGLNQTGMITVAVVATAVTGGAAIAYAPAAMGTWATIGYGAATAGASAATSTIYTSGINASMNSEGNALKQIEDISKITFKETTSKESIQNIAIAATTAALAAGASQAAGLTNAANATNTTASTVERVATNLSSGLQKAGIYSTSNILATSAIKQQSVNDTITEQGGGEKILLNSAINALAETGAKEIGTAYHNNQISKSLQLTLHGALGCAVGSTSGNCAAGAAGAIAGEIAGEKYFKSKLDEHGITEASGSIKANNIYLDTTKTDLTLNELTKIKLQTVELSKVIGAFAAVPFASGDDVSAIYTGSNASRNAVENNVVFYRAGTGSNPKETDKEFVKSMEETTKQKSVILFGTLENTDESRQQRAKEMATAIKNYQLAPGEPVIVVDHSHGGNVLKIATNLDLGNKKIDAVVMLGTPHRDDYKFNFDVVAPNAKLLNVFDVNDGVQSRGGIGSENNTFGFIGGLTKALLGASPAEKTLNGFQNIQIEQMETKTRWDWKTGETVKYQVPLGPVESHNNLDTAPVWNTYVKPQLIESE